MAEAVVVGLDFLPSPVLRGQFAVARIEIGDVFAFVVMERPREAIVFRTDLYRLHDENIAKVVKQYDVITTPFGNLEKIIVEVARISVLHG